MRGHVPVTRLVFAGVRQNKPCNRCLVRLRSRARVTRTPFIAELRLRSISWSIESDNWQPLLLPPFLLAQLFFSCFCNSAIWTRCLGLLEALMLFFQYFPTFVFKRIWKLSEDEMIKEQLPVSNLLYSAHLSIGPSASRHTHRSAAPFSLCSVNNSSCIHLLQLLLLSIYAPV